jgi:transcriptional regulator with XRE-family HTH domain
VPVDVRQTFGERVRELRQERGLTQEAFAAACRLDRTYISGIERGLRNPSLKNISRIAEKFGVSLSELFAGL